MSSPYLIVNRVGSMVPLVKPLDIRNLRVHHTMLLELVSIHIELSLDGGTKHDVVISNRTSLAFLILSNLSMGMDSTINLVLLL
ncbi:hypothetical protein Tco_0531897 [Tanacetum coccineum]